MSRRRRQRIAHAGARTIGVVLLAVWSGAALSAQQKAASVEQIEQPAPPPDGSGFASEGLFGDLRNGLEDAAVRLPLAALLGSALALRPRRASSPPRDPAVIETQIVLAVVGALIMLVVGASLARAFGIAGAANLIRYRAKIEDPKDAVVMLSALAVGLAAGVGLVGIAGVGTVFLVFTLWLIEGFQNRARTFLLTIKLGARTSGRRTRVERILRSAGTTFELRTTADDELCYLVSGGESFSTERLSAALTALAPDGKANIEWKEEKKERPLAEETT